MLDEFSEYLLETRINTSADFNMYPIRIFYIGSTEYILVTLDSPLIINSFHIFQMIQQTIL